MQTQGGQPAADAIETIGGKRMFRIRVLVDWNRDGLFTHPVSDISSLVQEAVLNRALSGSAPEELMVIEGYAAAELALKLEGALAGIDAVPLFSTYNGNSPLYNVDQEGCELTYQLGIDTSAGTVWYPQFVGNVRFTKPDRTSGTVSLSALDRAEKMRQPVQLPVWAVAAISSSRGWNRAQLVYSHWVIDQCLRIADTSTTPYRWVTPDEASTLGLDTKWGLQLWITGNGGYIPNVGAFDNARSQGFPKTEVGGAAMYTRLGEAHPNVKAEVETSLRRPWTLSATTTDATGIVPSIQSAPAGAPDQNRSYFLAYRAADPYNADLDRNGSHRIGFTLLCRGYGTYWQTADVVPLEVFINGNRTIRIHMQNGLVRCEVWNWVSNTLDIASPFIGIPTDQDSVQIEALFVNMFAIGGIRKTGMRAGVNSTPLANYSAYPTDPPPTDGRASLVFVRHQVAMQDIYWSIKFVSIGVMNTADFGVFARRSAKYAAVLDEGLNKLTCMPKSSYEDAWALAGAVADAEMGAIFWDELGVFRFWNRDTIKGLQAAAVRTITLDYAEDLGMTNSLDSVRNSIQVNAMTASADQAVIYSSDDVDAYYVAGRTDITIRVPESGDIQSTQAFKVSRYSTVANGFGFPIWNDNVVNGYVVEFLVGGVWAEDNGRTSGVDIIPFTDGQGNAIIRIWNGYDEPVRFSHLRVVGTLVSRFDNTTTYYQDSTSSHKYGLRNLPLEGDWIQNQAGSVLQLGAFVLDRTVKSIPSTDDIPIPCDPRLQLGDCLDVVDTPGLGELLRMQILGIQRVVSRDGGATDHLSVELIRPPGVGIWDSPQYGRWDQTLIWGP